MLNKYYKQQRYHSLDSGVTWVADDVYQKGALIEKGSIGCTPLVEWRDTHEEICENCSKQYVIWAITDDYICDESEVKQEKWRVVDYLCDECN
jgi:hypothetical protein